MHMYKSIEIELLQRAAQDQHLRKIPKHIRNNCFWNDWKQLHIQNEDALKTIIDQIGWPTISKVGLRASRAAWLIAQHADEDVTFQKRCLQLMCAEPDTEVLEVDIAYLFDRICVNEHQPQYFGTQFTNNWYGAYGPQPILDFETVDERRSLLGLDSLIKYKSVLETR